MNKVPNHTALKEWSSVIEAIGRGEQILLIRKGGIADARFGVEAERFYLYPTFFHQADAEPEPPSVTITHWCDVVRTWRVHELDALQRLAPLVAMPRDTLETRYRFRPDQALYVIAVRAYALPERREIEVAPVYTGCRSWISIDDEIAIDGSMQVLTDGELERRIGEIERYLSTKSQIAVAT